MVTEILQFTDLHLPPTPGGILWGVDPQARLRQVLADARRHHPQARLAILTGDLVHEPDEAAYARLDTLLEEVPWPCWSLPGNHDDATRMREGLSHAPLVERGAVGRWRLYLLDSTVPGEGAGRVGERQLAQLRSWLDQEPETPAVVFLHHHALPVGSPWLDAIMLRDAEAFGALMRDRPQVRAVLWGHTHQAFAGRIGSAMALGTPSTAMQFRSRTSAFALQDEGAGYRWLRLHPDGRLETGVRYVPSSGT